MIISKSKWFGRVWRFKDPISEDYFDARLRLVLPGRRFVVVKARETTDHVVIRIEGIDNGKFGFINPDGCTVVWKSIEKEIWCVEVTDER